MGYPMTTLEPTTLLPLRQAQATATRLQAAETEDWTYTAEPAGNGLARIRCHDIFGTIGYV